MNNDIDIHQEAQAVQTDVDQTQAHTVFLCKITVVARVTEKYLDPFKGSAVQEPSGRQAGEKHQKEKDVSKEAVGVAGEVVKMVVPDRDAGVDHAHSPVQKAEEKESEHTVGQTAVVEKVAFVPGIDPGKDSRSDESEDEHEHDSQKTSAQSDRDRSCSVHIALYIAEQKLTDKGGKAGRKHTDMQVIIVVEFFQLQIQEGRQKTRPHIEKIEPVEAV